MGALDWAKHHTKLLLPSRSLTHWRWLTGPPGCCCPDTGTGTSARVPCGCCPGGGPDNVSVTFTGFGGDPLKCATSPLNGTYILPRIGGSSISPCEYSLAGPSVGCFINEFDACFFDTSSISATITRCGGQLDLAVQMRWFTGGVCQPFNTGNWSGSATGTGASDCDGISESLAGFMGGNCLVECLTSDPVLFETAP